MVRVTRCNLFRKSEVEQLALRRGVLNCGSGQAWTCESAARLSKTQFHLPTCPRNLVMTRQFSSSVIVIVPLKEGLNAEVEHNKSAILQPGFSTISKMTRRGFQGQFVHSTRFSAIVTFE